jgi:hypothetical protein
MRFAVAFRPRMLLISVLVRGPLLRRAVRIVSATGSPMVSPKTNFVLRTA